MQEGPPVTALPGMGPVVDEGECPKCDRFLIRIAKGNLNEELCRFYDIKEKKAEVAKQHREKRHSQARVLPCTYLSIFIKENLCCSLQGNGHLGNPCNTSTSCNISRSAE